MSLGAKARIFALSKVAAVALLFGSLWVPAPGVAAAGIFAAMSGAWRGDGSIRWYSGETERIRCKATNDVAEDGYKIEQTLTCANPSLGEPWRIKSSLAYREAAGVVVGTWSESKYGMSGNLTGRATISRIDAQVRTTTSSNVSVRVLVTTSGNQQAIVLKVASPEGLTEVSVTMRKG